MNIAVTSIVDLERTAHNRCQEFVRELAREHDVTVFSISDWWKGRQVGEKVYRDGFEDVLEDITVHRYTDRRISPIAQEALAVKNAKELITRMEEPPDVHLDYNTLLSGGAFGKRFAKDGIPTVYDLADDLVAMVRSSPQIPGPLRPVGAALASRALGGNLDRASRVTSINRLLADENDLPPDKVRLVPNGVDTRLFQPGATDVRERLAIEDAFVLGYVGVLREWVDLSPVLEAVAELNATNGRAPVKVLVVGGEGDHHRFEEEVAARGIEEHVLFTGTVPYHAVPKYVNAFDVGLIPFDTGAVSAGSLPLKLFEYMACGKPVVSSPLPGVQESAGDRVHYAATAEDHVRIVSRLRDQGPDQGLLKENRTWVDARYSWTKVGTRLSHVLEETVSA